MTCASTGRAAHGTLDSDEHSSPYTTSYYKYLGLDDIAEKIKLGQFFEKHSFEVEALSGDLYFWGIRNANEFKECIDSWLSPLDRLARAQGQLAQAASRHAAICKERDAAAKDKAAAQQSATELHQQLTAQAEALQQAQKARDEQTARINTLEAQLVTLTGERDAAAKDKAAAKQSATELQQQLASQAEALKELQKAHEHQATKVELLEAELSALQHERDALIKGNAAAQESAAKFRQELSDQTETLRQVQQECIQRSQQLEQLESDFHALRLRHLHHRRS